VLRDDTRLSLGPESEIRIDRFLFAPAKGHLALVVKMARGVMAFVSGNIAKLSHDAVRVETPVAIVGVRGTQFLVKVEHSKQAMLSGDDGTGMPRIAGRAVYSCCLPHARPVQSLFAVFPD
jgi:hypothetical protein